MAGGSPPLRYAYFDCEDAAKWAGHEATAFQLLQPGAQWTHYRCYQGELPPLEGLSERIRGVLISGSHYSVYEGKQGGRGGGGGGAAWLHSCWGSFSTFLKPSWPPPPCRPPLDPRAAGLAAACGGPAPSRALPGHVLWRPSVGVRWAACTGGHSLTSLERVWMSGLCAGVVPFFVTPDTECPHASTCHLAALGGRVGKNASGRFALGVERIELLPALRGCAAWRLAASEVGAAAAAGVGSGGTSAAAPRGSYGGSGSAAAEHDSSSSTGGGGTSVSPLASLALIESHGDCVLELPPGAVLLARSPTAPVEMFTMPSGNVLGVQASGASVGTQRARATFQHEWATLLALLRRDLRSWRVLFNSPAASAAAT